MTGISEGTEVTYGEFGRQLFRQVLDARRIEDAVATVLGDRVDVGPFGAGPGRRLATIRALGSIGRPQATELPGDFVAFLVELPVTVDVDLAVAGDVHRFHARVVLPLRLTARAAAPLTIVLEITPPHADEVRLAVEVDKRRTAVLRRVASIDEELRRFLARYVARELEKEHVVRATHLHLGDIIDAAWPMITRDFLARPAIAQPPPCEPAPEAPGASSGSLAGTRHVEEPLTSR